MRQCVGKIDGENFMKRDLIYFMICVLTSVVFYAHSLPFYQGGAVNFASIYSKEKVDMLGFLSSNELPKHSASPDSNVSRDTLLEDSYWVNIQLHRLAKVFGTKKTLQGTAIEISYASLHKYAATIEDARELLTRIDSITDKNELYELSKQIVFEISPEYDADFRDIFNQLVRIPAGEQRIKSLILLQNMISNNIGGIGSSYYRGKRIKIILKGYRSNYDDKHHTLEINEETCCHDDKIRLSVQQGQAAGISALSEIASTTMHELSHAYHMLCLVLVERPFM
jgi:hypothetical protein